MKKYILKLISIIFFLLIIVQINSYATDKVVVLDPGHGGVDTGAVNSAYGIVERDVNLKIANYVKEYLSEYAGINVILTHKGFQEGTMKLEKRVEVAKKNNADLLLCLHCNSSPYGNLYGAEAFVTVNNCLPKYNQECTKVGNLILNNLNKLGIVNRGVKTKLSGDKEDIYSDGTLGDYYGIIRYSMMRSSKKDPQINIQNGEGISTVLVEHCFVNGSDINYLNSEEKIKQLAKADADAVVEYYGLRLKKELVSSVELDKKELKMLKNSKEKLAAKVLPDTSINKNVKWKSSDEKVAKVDENGEITAVGIGNAVITVTTDEGKFTSECSVNVTGIEVEAKEIYLLKDEKFKINYEPKDMPVNFEIDKEDAIKIDENRNVIGLKDGIAKVTVKSKLDATLSDTITVHVKQLKESQKLKVNNLKEEYFKLTRIKKQITVENFKKNFEVSDDMEVKIENNKNEYITTGTQVVILDKATKNIIKKYECLVFGDINKDGNISASDYVLIKNHIMELNKLDSKTLEVADVSRDGDISAKDYVLIKNNIMNGTELPIE